MKIRSIIEQQNNRNRLKGRREKNNTKRKSGKAENWEITKPRINYFKD